MSFSLPVSHPDSMEPVFHAKREQGKVGQHERGDVLSVTEVIFPLCCYSQVQTFPFSIPATVQSLFFLAGKAPAAAHK